MFRRRELCWYSKPIGTSLYTWEAAPMKVKALKYLVISISRFLVFLWIVCTAQAGLPQNMSHMNFRKKLWFASLQIKYIYICEHGCVYIDRYIHIIYLFFSLSLSQPIMSFLIHFQTQVIPFPRLATQGKKKIRVPVMAQQNRIQLGTMRLQFPSLALAQWVKELALLWAVV